MNKDEDSYNFDSDSSDLCYRVAQALADSGLRGRVLVYIRCLGDLLITTQAEQSVRLELRRENCEEVRGWPEIMNWPHIVKSYKEYFNDGITILSPNLMYSAKISPYIERMHLLKGRRQVIF